MKQQAIENSLDYLTSIPAWYLATVEDDQPHVRPFSFAAAQDERIWFCTATTKDVYRELERNPKFELTAWKPGSGWIILRGRADLASFCNYNAHEMLNTIRYAKDVYFNRKREWNKIIDRGMAKDFSWGQSAQKYAELYDRL